MSKKPTQEQIEKFFDMARYGEHDLIKMLESMPEYRDIEDSRGINIFNHLVSNNHHAVIKEVLEKGLSSYSMFRKVGIDMANSIYRNDRHYNTFNLLKKEDKQTMAENGWYCLVEYNNIKTLSDIGIEDLAKNI